MLILENVNKLRRKENSVMPVLNQVSIHIEQGEYVSIVGKNGSGKTALSSILACLDTSYTGEMYLGEARTKNLSDTKRAKLRLYNIGCVFKSSNLISRFSVLQNVELPMIYGGSPPNIRWNRCNKMLQLVGMESKLHLKPGQLSAGQQQWISIARALVNNPQILIANESTYMMEPTQRKDVLNLFQQLQKSGKTVIHVTDDPTLSKHAQRTVSMSDGKIVSDTLN